MILKFLFIFCGSFTFAFIISSILRSFGVNNILSIVLTFIGVRLILMKLVELAFGNEKGEGE